MPDLPPGGAGVPPADEQDTDTHRTDRARPADSDRTPDLARVGDHARSRDPESFSRDLASPSRDLASPSRDALAASFGYAFSGLWYALRTQQNMRIHLSAAIAVVALGLYLGLDWMQWAVLTLTMGAVMIAEMFNTVAEAALDAATPYYHPLVKIAKDVAAGAVLLTAIMSVGVGLLVLGPPLWSLIVGWLGR
jgi:diacylglycerol kinase